MVSQSGEQAIYLQKSGLLCTWHISPTSSKSFLNLVRSPPCVVQGTSLTHPSANVLGIKEDSRTGVIQALWNYIKIQGLQDKVDRRLVRADEKLRPVRNLKPLYATTS